MVTEIVKISSSLVSWWSTIVVDNPTVAGAALLGEGDDHQGDRGVEDQVGDGHPVLQACPVADEEDVKVLDAAAQSDENPKDEKAPVSHSRSDEQENGAENAEEGVEDTVLDDGADADVFALAIHLVHELRVLDHVGDGHDDGDDELDEADDVDGLLQGHATH